MISKILLSLRSIVNPYAQSEVKSKKPKKITLIISKRQKFLISVTLLSAILFFSEYFLRGFTVFIALGLAILTDIFLFFSLKDDGQGELLPQAFVLPFLCSLAFGLFYFLTPARFLSRIVLTTLYAIAVYSLFLSENIFLVATVRTIALINSARIVTFVITLVSYFFLSNIIFSFRISLIPTIGIYSFFTFLFVYQILWAYTLEKQLWKNKEWVGIITLCIGELGTVLWFWPTTPTVLALFLTAALYMFTGLSHMWFDKRLFRGVIWEYAWVGVFAGIILLWLSKWQG